MEAQVGLKLFGTFALLMMVTGVYALVNAESGHMRRATVAGYITAGLLGGCVLSLIWLIWS